MKLKIDDRLLFSKKGWDDKDIYMYGLDFRTIILSPQENRDWIKRGLFTCPIPLKKCKNGYEVDVPQKIVDFYWLNSSNIEQDMSGTANHIFITPIHKQQVTKNE